MGQVVCPFLAFGAGVEKTTTRSCEIRPPPSSPSPDGEGGGRRETGGNPSEGKEARGRGTYRIKAH